MKDENRKEQAIESLLQLKQNDTENVHFDRLQKAFSERAEREPDFALQKEIIRKRWAEKRSQARVRRQVYLPVAAAAALAIGIGFWLLNRQAPTNFQEAAVAQLRPAENPLRDIAGGLSVRFRPGADVTERRSTAAVVYEAKEIAGHFRFKPNENIRNVAIQLPHVRFTVVGTEFIVKGNAQQAFLAVKSGVVRVAHAGHDYLVRGGDFWSLQNGKILQGHSGKAADQLFASFHDLSVNVDKLVDSVIHVPAQPVERPMPRITVTLKSGSEIRGLLASEDASALYVKTAATGGDTIRISKDEIAKRSQAR